jgi:hypothetical protein
MPEKPTAMIPKEPPRQVIDLQAAVASLAGAILAARVALDAETARLAKAYQQHEILRHFTPPAFGIGEVTVRLPYAALDVAPARIDVLRSLDLEEIPHMLVQVNADTLAKLPPQAVGSVELKLTQEQFSVLLTPPSPE